MCEVGLFGMICIVYCNLGYGFVNVLYFIYVCSISGIWFYVYLLYGSRKFVLLDCLSK